MTQINMHPLGSSFLGLPVYLSSYIPLTRTHGVDEESYDLIEVESPLLYVQYRDTILVHPDRWDTFQEFLKESNVRNR